MPLKPNGWTHSEADLTEHVDGLYCYALVLTRDHSEAGGLVEDTYIRACGTMKRFRTGGNVKGWMFTILRNIWRSRLRSKRAASDAASLNRHESDAATVVVTSKDLHARCGSGGRRDQIREAIQQLPLDLREVMLLREFEDLSYLEIATILDCSISTVMSRLTGARSRLRASLSPILSMREQSASLRGFCT
jgi:RNA polymerase sigma-70 factor (ECF subfamily)